MKIDKRICVVLIVAFLFRFVIFSFYPIVGDANHHINGARYIAEHWEYPPKDALIINSQTSFFYPPLIHFIYALLITIFNLNYSSYHLLGIMPVIAGTLSIFFIYKLMLNLKIDQETAIKTAIVASFLPIHMIFSGVLYLTVYVVLFATAAANYFLEYVENKSRRSAFLAIVFSGISAMSHLSGLTIALFQLLYLVKDRKIWKVVILSLIVCSPMYVFKLINYGNPFWIGQEGIKQFTDPMVWDPVETFFSFWIGGPTAGSFYERMIEYLPETLRIFVPAWVLVCILFTVLLFIGFIKVPRVGKILMLSAIPPFLITANMTRKLLGGFSIIALSLVFGISFLSERMKIKESLLLGMVLITSLHVIPLSYMMGERWNAYDAEYQFVRQECTKILSSELGRIEIMTDVDGIDFGRYGIDESLLLSGDYAAILEIAIENQVDCVFYDDYTLTRMVDSETSNLVMGLVEYLGCEKQTVDGLGFYLCPIGS